MAAGYVDSSVLLAIALEEQGWKQQARWLASFEPLLAGNLVAAEFLAALRRERVSGEPTLLGRLNWIFPSRSLEAEIGKVLDQGPLRGADCWHLAVALYVAEDPATIAFLTLDRQQSRIAKALGFRSEAGRR